jgi:hypothetical protein
MQIGTDPEIEAQVERLTTMRIAELRTLYVQTFRSDPPKAFGPDLLRRSIAYRIQEKAYGGLDKVTAQLLKKLVAEYARNPGKLVLPRRIKPGAILVRKWKDQRYQVTVMEKGFAYEGKTYDSLSEIARLITGARWNGPRFFGLRRSGEHAEP